ncbi:MAG: right-handed parallel beta-helix repeat-containing protein [Bacteroidales bacterium]|nr:right-handed parallel beta-helix repeat-containing protein [Bacteroidales bacterium]
MKRILIIIVAALFTFSCSSVKEYHVAKNGSDNNPGTKEKPLLTIQAAANLAQPGDMVTVHEGVYRESINAPRGGLSDDKRITYQSAQGEKVIIKGSEVIKGWVKVEGDIWKKELPNTFFGNYNPYAEEIKGHWFFPRGRKYHTGVVYLNGEWLKEAESEKQLMARKNKALLWFGKVDGTTTIMAQFPNVDPNKEEVEINVRETVFFPDQTGLNYITVRGFTMQQAAPNWAAPTQPQKGLIGPNWSKGWIIENNYISHSKCTGVCLGRPDLDTASVMNAPGMIAAFQYASEHELWTSEKIGHHIIRNNRIKDCGQAGIVGNMGPSFSIIEENEISDINVLEHFDGMEQGGIKLHAGVDIIIQDNCVYNIGNKGRGIWLDWLGQGSIIRNNLIFDTDNSGLYLEVNHGPILCANNIVVSTAFTNRSRGSAMVHNLFDKQGVIANTSRTSPYLVPHSTTFAGMYINDCPGDDRFYNNIYAAPEKESMAFGGSRTKPVEYDDEKLPLLMGGNIYINGALPYKKESDPMIVDDIINLEIIKKEDGFYIEWFNNPAWTRDQKRKLVTTEILGKTIISDANFEYPNGSPVVIDTDYFGNPRDKSNPTPGPFEGLRAEKQLIKIWPKK